MDCEAVLTPIRGLVCACGEYGEGMIKVAMMPSFFTENRYKLKRELKKELTICITSLFIYVLNVWIVRGQRI